MERNYIRWVGIFITLCRMLIAVFVAVGEGAGGRTIILDDDGSGDFVTIQDAVNASEDGDTIRVFAGTYHENVVVNTSVSVIGNGSDTTKLIQNMDESVVMITADHVNVSGFTIIGKIEGQRAGIFVKSEHCMISENEIRAMESGIGVSHCNNITIEHNQLSVNVSRGVGIDRSANITIADNIISYSKDNGIWARGSTLILIERNWIVECGDGIHFFETKECNITRNNIRDNINGVVIYSSGEMSLTSNIIIGNERAIMRAKFTDPCENITLRYNRIYGNTESGIRITDISGEPIDARNNWWGDSSGPYHETLNPNGTGDNISASVDFDPWLREEEVALYVDDDALPGGDGSMSHPFNRIQDAIDNATEWDTIRVFDGTYRPYIIVNKTLHIVGNGSDVTRIDGEGYGSGIYIRADWVTLSGFRIVNCGSSYTSYVSYISGIVVEADNCTISNNLFEDNQCGITLDGAHYTIVENNTCTNGRYGIKLVFSSMYNSIVQNNCSSNYGDPFYIEGYDDPFYIYGKGIFLGDKCDNNVLSNNRCNYNAGSGIAISSSLDNNFEGNECSHNIGGGIHFQGSRGNVIANCTFRMNGMNAIQMDRDTTVITSHFEGNSVAIAIPWGSNTSIIENVFIGNRIGISIPRIRGNITILQNTFKSSAEYGISVPPGTETLLNATHNYWGHPSGPYHSGNNSRGLGDNVTDYVLFEPWIDENGDPVYLPDEANDDEDTPNRLLLSLLVLVLISLFIALGVVVSSPYQWFTSGNLHGERKGKGRREMGEQERTESTDGLKTITICENCGKSFEVDDSEQAIRIPCPHCGTLTFRTPHRQTTQS